jgi:Ca-activated chloride channel family protein
MFRKFLFSLVALAVLTTRFSYAQGLLVDIREDQHYRLPRPIIIWPHPPTPTPRPAPEPVYEIKELDVNVSLQDQIAKVQLSQSFHNSGSRPLEVCFIFPLPYDGAIDQMTFMLDGKEYDAKLLNAQEARRIYESHVRRNQDPALVEWMGTGMFKTSVFPVPAGATRKVTLKFSQLCRKHNGLTELTFPLSTAKYTSSPVGTVGIQVAIQSQAKIKNVYSPSHTVEMKRPSDNAAQVKYSATKEIPTTDFRLLYDVGDGPVGANVLSYKAKGDEDGYFMLLVSPEIKRSQDKPTPKTVVFVVDRSGSMSGKKIEQAKGALRFVLNNLREGDLFNIVAYDSNVESFKPELERYNDDSRKAALGYVEGLYAGGSTNIDGALQAAMAQLQDNSRPNYVVFLTDGLPTAGERNEGRIAENAKQRNKVRARIFSMGVGYDVNSRLLDKISRAGFGQSQYVRPNEDIEAHVSQLYARIGAPAMTDISITFDMEGFPAERGTLVNRLYPRDAYDLFAGDQLVLVGRYKQGGAAKVTIKGTIDGTKHEYHFPADLASKSNDQTFAFAEKLWAMRRVGEIIDEIDLNGKNQELVNELVALSTKHGILTPYTAFLADEMANPHDLAQVRRQAVTALDSLSVAEGVSGFVQRDIKAQLQRSNQATPSSSYHYSESLQQAGAGGMPGMSGMPGARGRAAMPALRTLNDDTPVVVTNVRQAGDKTFYRRNGRWVDATITEEQEKKVQKVERFGNQYFELLSKHGKDAAKYIASDEETVVVLEGQAYAF